MRTVPILVITWIYSNSVCLLSLCWLTVVCERALGPLLPRAFAKWSMAVTVSSVTSRLLLALIQSHWVNINKSNEAYFAWCFHRSVQYVAVAVASAIDLDQTVKNGLVKRKGSARERGKHILFFIDRQVTLGTLVCKFHYLRQYMQPEVIIGIVVSFNYAQWANQTKLGILCANLFDLKLVKRCCPSVHFKNSQVQLLSEASTKVACVAATTEDTVHAITIIGTLFGCFFGLNFARERQM